MCFDQYFQKYWTQFNTHLLRQERIWREENDITIKRLDPIIKALYAANSGKYATSKANNFMALDEFTHLIEKSQCTSETFGIAQITPCFQLSMMTYVDELNSSKFMNMTMTEFYEAICRVADRVPNGQLPNFYPIHTSVSPWGLDKKIESLII